MKFISLGKNVVTLLPKLEGQSLTSFEIVHLSARQRERLINRSIHTLRLF